MTNQLWGVHMGRHVGSGPVEGGYVAIGWGELGDLRSIPPDREAFKAAHIRCLPDTKARHQGRCGAGPCGHSL